MLDHRWIRRNLGHHFSLEALAVIRKQLLQQLHRRAIADPAVVDEVEVIGQLDAGRLPTLRQAIDQLSSHV